MKRVLSLLALTLAVAMLFGACGGKPEQAAPADTSTSAESSAPEETAAAGIDAATPADTESKRTDITIALQDNLSQNYVYDASNSYVDEQVLQCIHEPLYLLPTAADEPIMKLAESMEVSDDHLTYTFKLRQDVKFSNGDPMT